MKVSPMHIYSINNQKSFKAIYSIDKVTITDTSKKNKDVYSFSTSKKVLSKKEEKALGSVKENLKNILNSKDITETDYKYPEEYRKQRKKENDKIRDFFNEYEIKHLELRGISVKNKQNSKIYGIPKIIISTDQHPILLTGKEALELDDLGKDFQKTNTLYKYNMISDNDFYYKMEKNKELYGKTIQKFIKAPKTAHISITAEKTKLSTRCLPTEVHCL